MQRIRVAAGLMLALPLLAGCYENDPLNAPDLSTSNGLMARYVSVGNSITAGYQSAGINDSTQRRSYAVLFAGRANAPFFVPSLQGRGCAPPLTNNVTGARVGGGTGFTTTPLSGWYQAAKHALEGVSDALRAEVGSDGIQVVLVQPGGFKTHIWAENERSLEARQGSRYSAAYRRLLSSLELAELLLGNPEAVARVITTAMRSRRPRSRYLVGYDAQILALTHPLLPSSVRDLISRWTLGLWSGMGITPRGRSSSSRSSC